MPGLRVNETKITWRKALTVNLLALESGKKTKKKQQKIKNKKVTKGHSLETARGFLTCLLIYRPQMPRICGSLDCFNFNHLLDSSCIFHHLELS